MKIKLPRHKTKIVCTIGPASRSQAVLKKLIETGMNVARLNFAHGSPDEHRENIQRIRQAAAKLNRVVAIMADLPGPKIRIGKLELEPLTLEKGQSVTLTTRDVPGTASLIPVDYKRLPENVSRGSVIYLSDGFIQLRVQEIMSDEVRCKVVIGGKIASHKGLNLPRARISARAITADDIDLLNFGLGEGVDAFSVSFVEEAADLIKVKELARKKGESAFVVAKIERQQAVKNIDEILQATDALMIARGDLGVEVPIQDLPGIQKRIIHKANLLGRPVITATQMLESMTSNIRPTRAEVTDVANAILDGTDAVMLSEETAIGKYPVETVRMMARIATSIERQRTSIGSTRDFVDRWQREYGHKKSTVEDTISLSVLEALHTLDIRYVLTPTSSGATPRRISRFKPESWVLSFSSDEKVRNRLALSYGVYPILMDRKGNDWDETIIRFIKDSGLAKEYDRVILTKGVYAGEPSSTNSLKIITVG